jgi:carbamoyl-phosphate synthase large subunit
MKSTGEAMGLAENFGQAFAKAQMAVGSYLPKRGTLFISVKDSDKIKILPLCKNLLDLGFSIVATKGTFIYLEENNLKVKKINKVSEGRPHLVDAIKDGLS